MGTLGIKTVCPACSLVRRCTSKTLLEYLVKIPLLPLQTPFAASKFFSTMTGQPFLTSSFARGRDPQLISFKYSTVLQATKPWPDKEYTRLQIDSDTSCLRLLSLSFHSEFVVAAGIERWRRCVPCCEYGLCPAFVSDP